jgi:chemotaxis protein MotB
MRKSKTRIALIAPFGAALLLGACVSSSEHEALQQRYNAVVAQNQQLQGQNQQLQFDVSRLQDAIKYTVESDLLFAPGSWRMSAAGQDVIGKLAGQLAPTQQRKLMINGYTDNQPIGPNLQQAGVTSNEALSQKRAEAVAEYLVSRGFKQNVVAAKGWGEAQPIASNDSAEGRSRNRRVEITLAQAATSGSTR